jgi:TolA-binding protein
MQRSTVRSTRQAQALLPSDDDNRDHGSKMKSPTPSFYAQVSCKAFLAAILFVCAASLIYLNSKALSSQDLNNPVKAMQSNNGGLISDQGMALQSENERLSQQLESAQQDQVMALQSENERLRQRLESVKQSNIRQSKDKPGAVGSTVTSSRRSSIPVKVVGAPVAVVPASVLAAIAAPVATTNKKAGVVSALKPLVCQEFIGEAKSGMYRGQNFIDPNLEQSFIRQTITEHPFWISVHNKEFDSK